MSNIFIYIYNLFYKRRWLFFLIAGVSLALIMFGASRIRFVEEIAGNSIKSDTSNRFGYVVGNFRFTEKLVITLSVADTALDSPEEALCNLADSLAAAVSSGCGEYISGIFVRPDDSIVPDLMSGTSEYLPLFLDENDYSTIDTLTSNIHIEASLKKAYRQLLSPASLALRQQVLNDPLGIQGIALKKLQALQEGGEYEAWNGYILSRDHRHLLIFITPANPPGETGKNGEFLKKLGHILEGSVNSGKTFRAEYFGAAAVAAGNAERVKSDVILSLVIAFLAIFILIGLYFRSLLVPFFGLLPAVFGGGIALAVLALFKGSVSAIALGIGSVILGLIIDYSLYLINQYRSSGNVPQVLKEMSQSIVVCAITSAGAFLCLVFLGSSVLHDLGWFAAISVLGAALFALVLLPQMLSPGFTHKKPSAFSTFIDRIGSIRFERNYALITLIVLLAVASLYFYRRAGFETDMNTMNYMEPGLRGAGDRLENLSSGRQKNIYLVATGVDREHALRLNEKVQHRLDSLKDHGLVAAISGIRMLLLSDSLSQLRIARWNSFFTPAKAEMLADEVERISVKTGFKPGAFGGFGKMAGKDYQPMDEKLKKRFEAALFTEWINDKPGMSMVTTLVKIRPSDAGLVYAAFDSLKDGVVAFDRQMLTDNFVERVRRDFDRLVILSMLFVSILLWISFGRIELAVLTAIPMYLSWLITLGFMGVTGIRFNIFNIIISSFIFGLGVDYSILMMRGILQDYKYRTYNISRYRVSIILSSLTTLFGVAALFTARHPALNSIALISVFGITVLVLVTFTAQPLIAGWFLGRRMKLNAFPVTARIFIKTIITWFNIVFIAMILAVTGSLMYFLLPARRNWKENVFHSFFCGLSRLYIFLVFPDRRLYNPGGEDFKKPAVIISNHQSLIETPAMLRLYPKIIILTTTWVYNSPVFGPIARLASFYNVDDGLDSIMDKLKLKVSEGYSILIFPEAHRSSDGRIQRFHRGAFYLAEKLRLDILPVMMFGSGDFLQKGEFWGRPNMFRQRIYPRIRPGDDSYGSTYKERTRLVRQFYIREYESFRSAEGTGAYFRRKLVLNYIFKGPVLEWYLRVKLMLEQNYQLLNELVPRRGEILDLGCGYGFVSHMLSLTSPERMITAVDHDEEKIRIASNGFLRPAGPGFFTADIRTFEFPPQDSIILGDVLHYLSPADQEELLRRCMAGLRDDGCIIIRDADKDRGREHSRSELSEFFSTGTGFNKTVADSRKLHYISTASIEKIVSGSGFSLEVVASKTYSSNTYYLLRRRVNKPRET